MNRLSRTTVLVALLGAAILTGCAGSEEEVEESTGRDNVFVGDEPIYAVLRSQSDGGWVFGDVTRANREPDTGFLVRLNDLAPAFDTRTAECEPRPYRDNDRCNPLNAFRDKDVGVVGKIVDSGISAGTGGAIKSVSRTYTTTFDLIGFNAAVDQALLESGLDENRVELIQGLRRVQEKIAEQKVELTKLADRMLSEYSQEKRDNIRFELHVDGLGEYYSHDLDPGDFVTVSTNSVSVSASTSAPENADLLPCDAAQCVQKMHAALLELDLAHDARLSALRAKLDSETSAYEVDCSATEQDGYHFELACPQQLKRSVGGIVELPVTVRILSRDFAHLFPRFTAHDENLTASIDQGQLVIENGTNDFIDVQSISIYYNSHINTIADDEGSLDLAPHQRWGRPASQFSSPEIDIESMHSNMTPDKARRTRFSFGLAVKYSMRDRNAIQTIYAVEDFQVQCAIENRLRPGSCLDVPEPDSMTSQDE